MQQAGYHHADYLAQQLRIDMQARNMEILAMLQDVAANTSSEPAFTNTEDTPTLAPSSSSYQQANVITL